MTTSTLTTISISLATVSPSRAAFGVPLALGHHTRFLDLYRDYSSSAGMIADGFTVNDPTYKLARAMFAQSPRPPAVRVGRLPTPGTNWTGVLDLAGIVAGQRVTFTLVKADGTEVDVDVAFTTDAAGTATAVAALDATMTQSGDTVVFNSGSAGVRMFVKDISGFGDFTDTTADWAYDTTLDALLNADPGFYGVAIDVNSPANVTDVAAWALTNKRLFGASPQVTDPGDWTTTADALNTAGNDRVYSLVTADDPEAYGGAGWMSVMFAKDPGSATWAFKAIDGLTSDPWTESQMGTLDADNSNYYVTVKGVPFAYPGKAHGGEWLDVTRGVDWLEDNLATRLLALRVNNDKVPMTDGGISMIANEVRGALAEATVNPETGKGLLDAGWTVTVPAVSSVSAANRAARNLTGVEFEARLAGAVHTVTIAGRITA
ncbi:MAG: DUF3383 family protein [Propionibacteriaceae bacterium]|nr:DUF3383 family protein [Propionibacteriaceae bacterium]